MKFTVAVCQMISGIAEVELKGDGNCVVTIDTDNPPRYFPNEFVTGPTLSDAIMQKVRYIANMAVCDAIARHTKNLCEAEIDRAPRESFETKANA